MSTDPQIGQVPDLSSSSIRVTRRCLNHDRLKRLACTSVNNNVTINNVHNVLSMDACYRYVPVGPVGIGAGLSGCCNGSGSGTTMCGTLRAGVVHLQTT